MIRPIKHCQTQYLQYGCFIKYKMFKASPKWATSELIQRWRILKQDRGKKSQSGQTTSLQWRCDSHDLVESIKEATGTSVRNEDKTAYSKNFLDI